MANTARISRSRTVLVFVLILLPVALTAVLKYRPVLTTHQKITSLAILQTRLIGSKEYAHFEKDVTKRLHDALAEVPGLVVQELPAMDNIRVRDDLVHAANSAGANVLIVPTLTIDAGIMQLNLQAIETGTNRVIFNTPFQSSIDNYPGMMRAAGAALKRALFGQ